MTKKGSSRGGLSGSAARVAEDPIGQRLQEISILTRQIERKLGEVLEVNATDLAAMEQLITHGPLTPGVLATQLGVTTAASTQITDRLERAGHVSRERHDADRRKVLVVPAVASVQRALAEMTPAFNDLEALFGQLSATERKVIERFLGQLVELYRAAVRPARSEE
jgi:DNA-binding MarR family transcriptional regulator